MNMNKNNQLRKLRKNQKADMEGVLQKGDLVYTIPTNNLKSLYGSGVFPFWLYIKFFGKPVYKFARKKLKLNVYFSINCAHVLGAFIHAIFPLITGTETTLFQFSLTFVISFLIFPPLFYLTHKIYTFSN